MAVGCTSIIKEESDHHPFITRSTGLVLFHLVPLGDVTECVYVTVQINPHVRHTHLHSGQVASMGPSEPVVCGALVNINIL